MVIGVKYVGGAVQTTVSGAMTPSVPGAGGTFTVADATGYPASGNFEVKINRGLADEEHVKITSRSGTVFTVNARGYDGTSAQSHADGATCELYLGAVSVQLMVDHVDDVEVDPHSTKLLNNTRHDTTSRHTFDAALGTPGTPVALTPDITGSAGAGSVPARSDHAHNVPAAAPVAVGTALAEGAGTSFARDNHVHVVGTGAINSSGMFAAGVVDSTALATDAVTAGKIANAAIDDQALFSTDTQPFIVQASDPGAVGANKIWFDTTNRLIKVRNSGNSAWEQFADDQEANFDTSTNRFNNVTLGTGNFVYRYYMRIGDFLYVSAGFVLGTGGNVTGAIELQLPYSCADTGTTGLVWPGGARCLDASAGNTFSGTCEIRPDTPTVMNSAILTGAGVQWDTNTPFDWVVGDRCFLFGAYKRA